MENGKKKEIVVEVNLWPTKNNPWVCRVSEEIEEELLYELAKKIMFLRTSTAPRNWLPPRYVRIYATIDKGRIHVAKLEGGRVWRWPHVWTQHLSEQVALALQACYTCKQH